MSPIALIILISCLRSVLGHACKEGGSIPCESGTKCIHPSWICDGEADCPDGSDERDCEQVCERGRIPCESGTKCIHPPDICDGEADCPDGSDERDCALRNFQMTSIPKIKETINNSRSWLSEEIRRNHKISRNDLARAAIALHLSNSTSTLENQLIVKNVEMQIATALFRNETVPIPVEEIALYIKALLSFCYNPYNFYGFDLVNALSYKISQNSSVKPIAFLALCNAGHRLSQEDVNKLVKFTTVPSNKPFSYDLKLLAVMALTCIMNKTGSTFDLNITEILSSIKATQSYDGSFGNLYTSALIIQVLIANEEVDGWNIKNAFNYLNNQHKLGIFENIFAAYLILPLFNMKTLLSLSCSRKLENITFYEIEKDDNKINIQLRFWPENGLKDEHITHLRVPKYTSVFDIMISAQEEAKIIPFQWKSHGGEKYIYSISGIVNDPETGKHWQLYKYIPPDEPQLIETGVDYIFPEDEDRFVYWYKSNIE